MEVKWRAISHALQLVFEVDKGEALRSAGEGQQQTWGAGRGETRVMKAYGEKKKRGGGGKERKGNFLYLTFLHSLNYPFVDIIKKKV